MKNMKKKKQQRKEEEEEEEEEERRRGLDVETNDEDDPDLALRKDETREEKVRGKKEVEKVGEREGKAVDVGGSAHEANKK